jgi:(S)-citramalyl-CoA lyase
MPTFRSILNTCALHPHQYGKAQECGADLGLLDLEDSVPPAEKERARRLVLPFLAAPQEAPRALRINGLHTPEGLCDIAALAASGACPDVLLLPKVESVHDVRLAEHLLAGGLAGVPFFAILETPRGLHAADEIAAAGPRVAALIFGAADYAAQVGTARTWENLVYARSRLLAAARRAGIAAIDSPCFALGDEEEARLEVERAVRMGFDGKIAIHPKQVALLNASFPGTRLSPRR